MPMSVTLSYSQFVVAGLNRNVSTPSSSNDVSRFPSAVTRNTAASVGHATNDPFAPGVGGKGYVARGFQPPVEPPITIDPSGAMSTALAPPGPTSANPSSL